MKSNLNKKSFESPLPVLYQGGVVRCRTDDCGSAIESDLTVMFVTDPVNPGGVFVYS